MKAGLCVMSSAVHSFGLIYKGKSPYEAPKKAIPLVMGLIEADVICHVGSCQHR